MSDCAPARFDRSRRLLNSRDYSRVFDQPDARASHRHLLLLGRYNDAHHHRLGLVIAKKNIRRAVDRNRVKRLTREFFRQLPPGFPGMDIIVLARRGLDELDNQSVSTILRNQWQKLSHHARATSSSSSQDS